MGHGKTTFWLGLGAVLALLVDHAIAQQSRPNIVLIMADDLGYETVGCYGGTSYPTPHIDRLAKGGIRFDRAYAMPLCTNTRIQLMTGKYNLRNWKAFGILDPNEKTFGHLMQQAGYRTCIAGKWQLTSYDSPDYPGGKKRRNTGMRPENAGFDEYSLWHCGHTEDKGSRYANPVIEQNGEMLKNTFGKYGPDLWTDFIGDFMKRNQDQPFFVYYSMALPHNPMVPTPDSPEWSDPTKRSVEQMSFAADMIRYTDKMVGKVVSQLERLNLRDKTLVLFYSDNGTNARVVSKMKDRVVRGEKGKATELGIRVPAVANWPGKIASGTVSQALIDSVDFLPTLLDVVGANQHIPKPIDGVSFKPILNGTQKSVRKWVYIHQDPRPGWDKDRFSLMRVAINQMYKLHEDGRLYYLVDDPFEESPIFANQDDDQSWIYRRELQKVLDSMKPYPMFDPKSVPRPNPRAHLQRHQFQDQGGMVVIEAEDLPIDRDESWLVERNLNKYSGTGYLRSLRDQPRFPRTGKARIYTNIDIAGKWRIAVRCRTDYPSTRRENEFWLKVKEGPWLVGKIPSSDDILPGNWQWVEDFLLEEPDEKPAEKSDKEFNTFHLDVRANEIWIAPKSANLKIDRIVLYQDDKKAKAKNLETPNSEFHPWASP